MSAELAFAVGDTVELRWSPGRYYRVDALKPWQGSPVGWMVACDGLAIPWVCASTVVMAPAGARPNPMQPTQPKMKAQPPKPTTPPKRVF